MKQIYYITVFLLMLAASAVILDTVAEAGSTQSWIMSHMPVASEIDCQ